MIPGKKKSPEDRARKEAMWASQQGAMPHNGMNNVRIGGQHHAPLQPFPGAAVVQQQVTSRVIQAPPGYGPVPSTMHQAPQGIPQLMHAAPTPVLAAPVLPPATQTRNGPLVITTRHVQPTPEPPQVPPADLIVVLCSWNRPALLRPQVTAIQESTIRPKALMCWVNPGASVLDEQVLASMIVVRSNLNWGPWPRFMMAAEADAEVVAILDDDVIVEPKWLEAAVAEARNDKIVAVSGIRYSSEGVPEVIGGPGSNLAETTLVDFGLQGWVLKRSWLSVAVTTPRAVDRNFGWGLHLSAALGIDTIVLPYQDDTGGTKSIAVDQTSLRNAAGIGESQARSIAWYREQGWRFRSEEIAPPTEGEHASESSPE